MYIWSAFMAIITLSIQTHATTVERSYVPSKFSVELSCNSTLSELNKVVKTLDEKCQATVSGLNADAMSCSDEKPLRIEFQSQACSLFSETQASSLKCHQVIKIAGAKPLEICVRPLGVLYRINLRRSDESNETRIKELYSSLQKSFEEVGCEPDGDPRIAAISHVPLSRNNDFGLQIDLYLPSKNCYLNSANRVASSGGQSTCLQGYEPIALYPVLDSKDAKTKKEVCRLMRPSSGRKQKTAK